MPSGGSISVSHRDTRAACVSVSGSVCVCLSISVSVLSVTWGCSGKAASCLQPRQRLSAEPSLLTP